MATVEAAILQIIEADASLADRFAILTSIPGVSTITAFALLIAMPELGALEAGQAANLAGLAPIARQSGALGRSLIHSRRARRRPASALHARPRRRTLQPRHEGQIRSPHRNRKAGKGRLDRNHAKARRPRKRPPEGQSPLDAKNRLINTDTLAVELERHPEIGPALCIVRRSASEGAEEEHHDVVIEKRGVNEDCSTKTVKKTNGEGDSVTKTTSNCD